MGLGLQGGGLGVAEFMRDLGAALTVTDLRVAEALGPSLARLGEAGVRYVLGRHDLEDFRHAEIVVRNPAVRLDSPFLTAAREAGAAIEMEMTLFLRWCRAGAVVGVTGTRGKTTTSSVLHAILQADGRPVVLAGNLRVSALRALDAIGPQHTVVLELSSWQTEGLAHTGLHPHGAIVTNLMPDHLDRYPDLATYAAAKAHLLANQTPPDWAVLPDDAWGDWFARRTAARVVRYSRSSPPPGWEHARLAGSHNRANCAAAAAAAHCFGVPERAIARAIRDFDGVPARQQLLGTYGDIRAVNDTTATIPEATLAALDTVPGPWVLIVGGSDKRLSFETLALRLRDDPNLRALILLPGSGTDRLRPLLGPRPAIQARTMAEAVDAAFAAAHPGDAVVLSPACASFGLFQNEFDRGDQFVVAVRRRGSTESR